MKLRKAIIHNYRAILHQELDLKDYSLLVGPNNGGKSTVIDAIRAFYEKDGFKFKSESDFPFIATTDSESWMELHFALTATENDSLPEHWRLASQELWVRKYFQTTQTTADGKSATGLIIGYKSDGSLSNESFFGAKNVQSGKFGDLVYIPAISKIDEHTKLSGPSALRDLLTDILASVIDNSEAYKLFSGDLAKFADSVKAEQTADQRSLSGFEGELNLLLEPWDTRFELRIPPPSANEIIKSMLNWDLVDENHGKPQGTGHFGSGFQRHLIYSLINSMR